MSKLTKTTGNCKVQLLLLLFTNISEMLDKKIAKSLSICLLFSCLTVMKFLTVDETNNHY